MGYILVYVLLSAFSGGFFQDVIYFLPNYFLYVSVLNVGHDKFERFLRG